MSNKSNEDNRKLHMAYHEAYTKIKELFDKLVQEKSSVPSYDYVCEVEIIARKIEDDEYWSAYQNTKHYFWQLYRDIERSGQKPNYEQEVMSIEYRIELQKEDIISRSE